MKVIVTCGPSFEPIDQVRRLTNFSTGQLGIRLADRLARDGFEVFCLKGSAATYAGPSECSHLSLFDTNDDLLDMLEDLARTHQVSAVVSRGRIVRLPGQENRERARQRLQIGKDCEPIWLS